MLHTTHLCTELSISCEVSESSALVGSFYAQYVFTSLKILRCVGRGLSHLHKYRIIHRDLAPRNVLVDGGGRALVTDFGLSKSHREGLCDTLHHTMLGKV